MVQNLDVISDLCDEVSDSTPPPSSITGDTQQDDYQTHSNAVLHYVVITASAAL
jgi:hypothetical protein